MKRLTPLLLLLVLLVLLCQPLTAYLTAQATMEWRFTVAPLAFSISSSSVETTDHGWVVTVTFSPDPGPQEIHLTLPPSTSTSPRGELEVANEKEE